MEDGDWSLVDRLDELPERSVRQYFVEGQPILISREGDQVYASDAVCPHKFGPLEESVPVDGCLKCPVHDATFDLETGRPRPGEEWAGRLPVYPARVDDGYIYVIVPRDPF